MQLRQRSAGLPCRVRAGADGLLQLPLDGFTGVLPALIPLRSQVQNVPAGPLRLLVSVLLPDLRPVARLVFLHGAPLERLKLCLVAHKLIPFF